ncbi:hypothetical protein QCA50_006057 [Cerrena zonata]|uniref:Arrestin-like N-terminal domain-containing protein n=1 Tax=Cerrena zonata TaxID=2478898 RepID=A0AAW0GMX5_9APHY
MKSCIDIPEQPVVLAGKLRGSHSWPFSIRLPRGICIIPGDGVRHTFRLPPSMDGKAQIRYHLLVRVKRGSLSSGQRLVVPFIYTPQARPAQASVLRQIAYLDSSPLIGPEGDPEGWRTLAPTKISGQIFNTRPVDITYTLSIARPLCYTRGTVIPLIMTVSTSDLQALDLLSAPPALCVRLARSAEFASSILSAAIKVVGPWQTSPEFIADAAWWPILDYGGSSSASEDVSSKTLHGEIRIPEDASPSCLILNFQLQYSVGMFPPKAVAFTPACSPDTLLLNQQVEVVTLHAQGPRPVAYLPPQYNPD